MWNEIFRRWIDGLFWWLPRNEQTPPEKEEEGAGGTEHTAGRGPEQVVEQQVEATNDVPDDLTAIKGIGLAVEEKLRSLGITTFRDLASADPDDLVDQLKASLPVSKARVRGWIEAARERTRARE
jgi:predicted flap endonuclease-1-like 5' DNA nuclease